MPGSTKFCQYHQSDALETRILLFFLLELDIAMKYAVLKHLRNLSTLSLTVLRTLPC